MPSPLIFLYNALDITCFINQIMYTNSTLSESSHTSIFVDSSVPHYHYVWELNISAVLIIVRRINACVIYSQLLGQLFYLGI